MKIFKDNKITSISNGIEGFVAKHKILSGIVSIAIVFIITCMVIPQFVAINFPSGRETHSIGSIALDKWQMNRVNRIEVESVRDGTMSIIEDQELISDIVSNTMVARGVELHEQYEN